MSKKSIERGTCALKQYIKYYITTLEPIKLAGQGSQQGQVVTRNFIQGSTIRGLIIGEFLKQNRGVQIDEDLRTRDKFLTGTKFYNAYIAEKGQMACPVPFVYYASKSELRKKGEKEVTFRIANEKEKEDQSKLVEKGNFCILNEKENEIKIVSVKKVEQLHIQKADEKKEESQMFRYEAMEQGQTLIGYIQCEERYVEEFKDLLRKKVFYIGGSKGSGYGKCEITFEENALSYEEYRAEQTIQIDFDPAPEHTDNTMLIYAMSDLILLDSYGMVTNKIDEKYLEKMLHIKSVKLEYMACDTSMTNTYNQKWKANGVQQTSVVAGSIYVYSYKFDEKERTLDAIKEIQEKGIGLRREEGFGQILINPILDKYNRLNNEKKEKEIQLNEEAFEKEIKKIQQKGKNEDKIFLAKVLDSIYQKQDYDTIVYQLVPEKKASLKKDGWRLSRTQANGIKKVLDSIYENRMNQEFELAQKKIRDYFKKQRNITDLEATILFSENDIPEEEVVDFHWKVRKVQPVSIKDFLTKMLDGTACIYQDRMKWNGYYETLDIPQTEKDKQRFYQCCLYLKELVRIYLREENYDE